MVVTNSYVLLDSSITSTKALSCAWWLSQRLKVKGASSTGRMLSKPIYSCLKILWRHDLLSHLGILKPGSFVPMWQIHVFLLLLSQVLMLSWCNKFFRSVNENQVHEVGASFLYASLFSISTDHLQSKHRLIFMERSSKSLWVVYTNL